MNKIKILLFISFSLVLSCSEDNEQTIDTTVSISDFTVTIDENPFANESLGIVEATTNQGSLTFSITEQSPNDAFEINSSTGEITVLTESLFNFETNPIITGIVKAENGGIFDNANITINLNNINEITVSISDFTVTIDENPITNEPLGIVEATTNQGSLTFSITDQSPNDAFEINSSTGEITVLTESLFDFETNPIITGIVKAENGGIFDNANITININEVSLQERLDNGETPYQIYQSDNSLLETLYGLTYQGGLIFYLNVNNGNGMISTPNDQSTNAKWGCIGTYIANASNSNIGSGSTNTSSIISTCSETNIAAKICNDLTLNGYSDWYLPSKDELNLLYNNLHLNGFGDFENGEGNCCNGWYWSSTDGETNGDAAWVQSFRDGDNGFQATYDIGIKDFENHVRAVRSY